MPIIEVEKLASNSSIAQAKAALSSCIATEIKNGREPDQAQGMCYSMVEEKIGRKIPRQGD